MSQTPSHLRWDAWPTNCISNNPHASIFFYTSSTPHAKHICTSLELWDRPFCLSLLAFFHFFGVAMKGIQFTQLCCHILFLLFARIITCFLSNRGRLLDSRKCWLYCQHIQHATRCLFEQWTLVGSLEAAVCGFYLSISLHDIKVNYQY